MIEFTRTAPTRATGAIVLILDFMPALKGSIWNPRIDRVPTLTYWSQSLKRWLYALFLNSISNPTAEMILTQIPGANLQNGKFLCLLLKKHHLKPYNWHRSNTDCRIHSSNQGFYICVKNSIWNPRIDRAPTWNTWAKLQSWNIMSTLKIAC